jgi:hypothetical protein
VMNGATVVLFSQSAAEGVNSCVRNTLGTSAPDRLANEAASVGRSLPHGAAVAWWVLLMMVWLLLAASSACRQSPCRDALR